MPGIDAADEFCAAWARYGGTIQIIAVAVNFGELDERRRRRTLELVSAPTIVDAVAEIEATWPADIAAERDLAVDGYLGPYAAAGRQGGRRARGCRGRRGADRPSCASRGPASWRRAIPTSRRSPSPCPVTWPPPSPLPQPRFDSAVTPWGADPSLTADLDEIPATKAYLAAHCTDLASIGIGDDI